MATRLSLAGYCITEQLYIGTRTLVYRGIRNSDQRSVVIKVLCHEFPSLSELVQFQNQYTIAKTLNSPRIIKPYSLEPYGSSYALVMEDFGGVSLSKYLKRQAKTMEKQNYEAIKATEHDLIPLSPIGSLSLSDFLVIALQLCDVLNELYAHHIIHKDIKPANILVHPETKQIKLIDFSTASLLPRETQDVQNPNVIEGTLAYLSPEQTGRMNRGIDYRSDYYSLGVTFFELLTGQLPFQSNDPMELLYCHIAKQPPACHDLNPKVPAVLSAIVSKLMAKNAEDRYQSALGLKHDLEQCAIQWLETETITAFQLGQRDITDRFLIPEKLYGREQEVAALLSAFERVAGTAKTAPPPFESPLLSPYKTFSCSELILIAGFSGIGKTAVVNEVHKPVVRQQGYFIKGKYDQFQRDIPFFAFVQAFRDLVAQLLSQSDAQLEQWKTKLLAAVGENGQVLIEVIPELEQIIGSQPPVPDLSSSAAQNRFDLLMQKFVQVFTQKEHPLVLFLDDLQWADLASLKLLQVLMQQTQHLLVIAAYRDNEVSATHPLSLAVDKMLKTGVAVDTITLQPLSQNDLNQLIADTLNCACPAAQPLADLVYQKTQGNPFFATQFLKALYEDGQITFDWQTRSWQCDIAAVRSLALTDDVVEFMALQLQKLPPDTQTMLKLAACIGAQFDLQTLAVVSQQSPEEVAVALWKALREGLILSQDEIYKFYQDPSLAIASVEAPLSPRATISYKFLHDRVQQAAYSLIPESQRRETHLDIGKLLWQNTAPEALESGIFDIVNQFNEGIEILTDALVRDELIRLNLLAGKKAKASTAYEIAVKYLETSIQLLPENAWETHYHLAIEVHQECIDCQYIAGSFDRAEALFQNSFHHAKNTADQISLYAIFTTLLGSKGSNFQANLEVGLQGFSLLGIELPKTIEELQTFTEAERQKVQARFHNFSPAALFDLPEMTDPDYQARMRFLVALWGLSYMAGNPLINQLCVLFMCKFSLDYGNTAISAYAYCLYGVLLANQGDYQAAFEFGQLALKLDQRFKTSQYSAKIRNLFGHAINPYIQPLETNLPLYQESFQICSETGDILYGVWVVCYLTWALLVKGNPLAETYTETQKYLDYMQRINEPNLLYLFTLQQQFLLNLQDSSRITDLLADSQSDSHLHISIWRQEGRFEHGICCYGLLKISLLYFYKRYQEAAAVALEVEPILMAMTGFFPVIHYYFYYPLSLTALYQTATAAEQQCYWEKLQKHQHVLKTWADSCPENFSALHLLISAEMAQVSGHFSEALELYDYAIVAAKDSKFIHIAAIANELAARFYLNWKKERIAQEYLIEAYYSYAHWGATVKINDLEQEFPQLLAPILQKQKQALITTETVFAASGFRRTSTSSSISQTLDLATILKVSQTLSREIELDKLLSILLQFVIENAGAEKCVLMLLRENVLLIEGIVSTGAEPIILQHIPVNDSQYVPLSLVYTVKHSLQPTVLINAIEHPTYAADSYISHYRSKSILCSPILNRGKFIGILYLENNLATGAFTRDRVELLNLLCAQSAISLENAYLYQQSQQYAQQLEHSLQKLSASEAQFQKLADNLPGMIYQFCIAPDSSTSMRYVSSGCTDLYGVPPEELMMGKRDLRSMEHPDDRPGVTQAIIYSAQTSLPIKHEWRIITPDGTVKWVQAASRSELQADGSILWDGVMLDISERKRAEAELKQRTVELENTLQELQQAQMQMIQAEKMSALGQLVAGVAHEINNPVNFIYGNLNHADEYTQDLLRIVQLYQQHYPAPHLDIQQEAQAIELEFLTEDLPKLLNSMKVGAARIQKIVASLRNFSRMDEAQMKAVNIHEGIDSTLMILQHRLKAKSGFPNIKVVKAYEELPLVECYVGQLNQVFMNLLSNAIDAVEEAFTLGKITVPTITVQTALMDDQQVAIQITDNGIGIPANVKQRLFDPFFTTKPVGKGTGMGLSISYQIVTEKHKGTLQCVSKPEQQNTTFIVTIPIYQTQRLLLESLESKEYR